MYTINDIDVYICTHNRARLIDQTLESLINQSINLPTFTILDNESTDDTEAVVKSYIERHSGINYIKTYNKYGNFLKAQELSAKNSSKYVMTFHDDDLLHPEFFEKVLLALNNTQNAPAFWISSSTFFPGTTLSTIASEKIMRVLPDEYLKPKLLKNEFMWIENSNEMAKYILLAESGIVPNVCVASIGYRKDIFINRKPLNDVYGKIDDAPMEILMANHGGVIVLQDRNCVFSRKHFGCDGLNKSNGLNLQQAKNWIKVFTDQFNTKEAKEYTNKLVEMIRNLYPILISEELYEKYPTKKFIEELVKEDILSDCALKIKNLSCPYKESPKISFDAFKYVHSENGNPVSLFDKIFSIKYKKIYSMDKNWAIYKIIRILGMKFRVKMK